MCAINPAKKAMAPPLLVIQRPGAFTTPERMPACIIGIIPMIMPTMSQCTAPKARPHCQVGAPRPSDQKKA